MLYSFGYWCVVFEAKRLAALGALSKGQYVCCLCLSDFACKRCLVTREMSMCIFVHNRSGDRRAASGMNLEEFNFDSHYGRSSVRFRIRIIFALDLVNVRIEGLALEYGNVIGPGGC